MYWTRYFNTFYSLKPSRTERCPEMSWTVCRVPADPGISMFCLGRCGSAILGISSRSQALLPSETLFICARGNRVASAISPERPGAPPFALGNQLFFQKTKAKKTPKTCLWFAWFAELLIWDQMHPCFWQIDTTWPCFCNRKFDTMELKKLSSWGNFLSVFLHLQR